MAATDYITLTTALETAGVQIREVLGVDASFDFAANPTDDESLALAKSQDFANGEIHRHIRGRITIADLLADPDAMRSLQIHGSNILMWNLTQFRQFKQSDTDRDAYLDAMKFLTEVRNGKTDLLTPGLSEKVSSQENPRNFEFTGSTVIKDTMANFSP